MTQSDELHELYFYGKSEVGIGQIERFMISYDCDYDTDPNHSVTKQIDSLFLKIKNVTNISYVGGYLIGPFALYCDVKSLDYNYSQGNFSSEIETLDMPSYSLNLQPNNSFLTKLPIGTKTRMERTKHVWIVDVVSEILFNKKKTVAYEISVGSSKKSLAGKYLKTKSRDIRTNNSRLHVEKLNTEALWERQLTDKIENQNIHLVILTHGIHSNATADMFYLREQIMKSFQKNQVDSNDIIVVKGYTGNICETERGIKYLGEKLAKYIINDLYDDNVTKISFIGHSLGGLVQTFALAYISILYPWFFKKVMPINFITLASPLLGLRANSPQYVKHSLNAGIVGKTGLDLNLHRDPDNNDNLPLLYLLSGETIQSLLRRFKRRSIYSNIINDGIVPLYTSSLLYLEYDEILAKLAEWKQKKNHVPMKIPRTSVIASMSSLLIAPKPDELYISDSNSRISPIIHDKIYDKDDIVEIREKYKHTILQKYLKSSHSRAVGTTQDAPINALETIANNWHSGMTWRKIVVALKPDAHNNIIVRRRFGNAYGWPVVDHLVNNHFGSADTTGITEDTATGDTLAGPTATDGIEPNKQYSWLTRVGSNHKDGVITSVSNYLQRSLR